MTDETEPSALFLSEYFTELNEGAGFLNRLSADEIDAVRAASSPRRLDRGDGLFFQGDRHTGVWIIESGRIRTYYAGPSGREITLAYWTHGHFVGGPEVFGGGRHIWSGDALEPTEVLYVSGPALRGLITQRPGVALAIIDGLVAKGKCYSALVQMLGTRSVSERLEHLLVILANTRGKEVDGDLVIDRTITHEQLASMVGATRQWVTMSLEKLQKRGVVAMSRKQIVIRDIGALSENVGPGD
jgi:CRP-like cAMP-binding protein